LFAALGVFYFKGLLNSLCYNSRLHSLRSYTASSPRAVYGTRAIIRSRGPFHIKKTALLKHKAALRLLLGGILYCPRPAAGAFSQSSDIAFYISSRERERQKPSKSLHVLKELDKWWVWNSEKIISEFWH